jgi:CheY-like chemotaxis protein
MPSMGGPELVRRLRALRPDLRVLLMSGYTDDATLRRGFSRQDEAFLEKPFTPAALAQRVRSLLDAGSGSARRGITEYGQQQHDV